MDLVARKRENWLGGTCERVDMQDRASEFRELIDRAREGSHEAARELIAQYDGLVLRVVRRHLPRALRRVLDSRDIAQSVWKSVFRHRSRLRRFATSYGLGAFVARVAANKVRLEYRRRLQQTKHSIRREHSGYTMLDNHASSAPTPSEVAAARERWQLLNHNRRTSHQEIIRLRYLGHSSRDVADRLGLDEGSVRRILRMIRRDAQS